MNHGDTETLRNDMRMGMKDNILGAVQIIPLVFLSALSLGEVAFAGVSQVEFSVRGKLEIWVSAASIAEQPQAAAYDYYAETKGSRYKIRLSEVLQPENYFEYVYSGKDLYVLHHKRPAQIMAGGVIRQTRDIDFAPYYASISTRDIPPLEPSRPQFVWFAYFSSDYFRGITNNRALPIWSPEDPSTGRQPFDMQVVFQLCASSPGLPLEVDFMNDGFYRAYNTRVQKPEIIPLSPPYDQGFTNAFYRVPGTTNCGELVLPASFVFQVYSSPISPSSTPAPRLIVRGTTLSVSRIAREGAEPPDLAGVASVTDWRSPSARLEGGNRVEVPYLSYLGTNGVWLNAEQIKAAQSNNELKVEKLIAAEKWRAPLPSGRVKVLRWMLLLTIVPLVVFLIKYSACRRKQK